MFAATAYVLFNWLDGNISDNAKAALAQTMRWKDYRSEQVALALVEVFDKIYTYPLFHRRAFFRSFIFTATVSAFFLPKWIRDSSFKDPDPDSLWLMWLFQSEVLGTAILINVITDYLSLFLIRPLLLRSGNKPVICLALGGFIGAAIVLVANALRSLVLWGIWCAVIGFLCDGSIPSLRVALTADFTFAFAAIVVFIWLPLFALSIATARLLAPLSWMVEKTQWLLKEGEKHPLKAIGYVSAILVFAAAVVVRTVQSQIEILLRPAGV
jgi:hypothetical protein